MKKRQRRKWSSFYKHKILKKYPEKYRGKLMHYKYKCTGEKGE